MKPLYDISKQELEVGDIVLRPIFSTLRLCQILHITKKTVHLSVCRNYRYIDYLRDLKDHNDRVSVARGTYGISKIYEYPELLLVEKNVPILDNLKKFVKLRPIFGKG